MGIIDSLSAGFRLVMRRPWLIAIPIVLDLFLWLGPQLSVLPLMRQTMEMMATSAQAEITSNEDFQAVFDQMRQSLDDYGANVNMLTLVTAGIPGIPSVLAGITPAASLLAGPRGVVEVSNLSQALLWGLLLMVAGAAVGGIYMTWVGVTVTRDGDPAAFGLLDRQTFRTGGRLILLGLLIRLLVAVASVPLSIVLVLALQLGQSLGAVLFSLLLIILLWVVVWVVLYLYFIVDAIVINRVGILRAVWNSVNVVMRNLLPTVGLIFLIYVISAGLMLIWQRLSAAALGAVAGIVANAFVGCGLTAAGLIFYRERYTRWQAQQDALNTALFKGLGGPKSL